MTDINTWKKYTAVQLKHFAASFTIMQNPNS